MNFFKTLFVALLFALPLSLSAQAKFGHLNIYAVRDMMPQVEKANKKLDTIAQQYNSTMQELSKEYETLITTYQTKVQKGEWSSPEMQNLKATEIKQLEERIMAFKENANTGLQKKTEELMGPINKQIKDAIKTVAKEGNYAYIFDSGAESLLFANDADDVTSQVKKKLGITK